VWFERSDSLKSRREDVGTAASNELRSAGERLEFGFPNGLLYDAHSMTALHRDIMTGDGVMTSTCAANITYSRPLQPTQTLQQTHNVVTVRVVMGL